MHEVWQIVLEETDRVGKVRLQAADTYLLQISEPCKPVRTAKSHVAKKVGVCVRLFSCSKRIVVKTTHSQWLIQKF